ncbi:MAG: CRISPR-associated helicase Cas3', partial [Oscillospiraceae bacterium]|nr:CRISPR-associated helicase Cas3' [Oscillospiraceae bacterium]
MGIKIFWARYDKKTKRRQALRRHAKNVAEATAAFARSFGVDSIAKIVGMHHDDGKKRPKFQSYLFNEDAKRGSVKHSIIGAKSIYNALQSYLSIAEMLANIIVSHHGSLRDYLSPNGDMSLLVKLQAYTGDDDTESSNVPEINATKLLSEIKAVLNVAPDKLFGMSMLTKFIYSCVIDADRFDAYLFESEDDCTRRKPDWHTPQKPDWSSMLAQLEQYLATFDTNSEIMVLRGQVSEQCAKAGLREKGIYKLEVPTGGGKTLSSLRFALKHAARHNLDRIIYVIPYLSILDQTAKEIRDSLGIDDKDYTIVLEHHSNFSPKGDDKKDSDVLEHYNLLTDRWDAPIILTTQVQFLESVFSAKGSALRKLHHMANSVMIFDEVQSLPVKGVHLFNSVTNFLHKVCGSTILLCTATQPLLDKVKRPILLSDNRSIADCNAMPKRTCIVNKLKPSGYTFLALAEFVLAKHNGSTLVIVNTKAAAKLLFEELKSLDVEPLHLSTNMCPAHRNIVIAEIRRRLKAEEDVICISTQLIEAGVNISFECVIRDIAGLDSIYQAAGRCNRHGEYGATKKVYVINIAKEDLSMLPDIKIGAEITRRLFDDSSDSKPANIDQYYELYFYARKNIMDYPIKSGGTIYDLLTCNQQGRNAYRDRCCMQGQKIELTSAIRSASDMFYVIAPGQTDVIVPYG